MLNTYAEFDALMMGEDIASEYLIQKDKMKQNSVRDIEYTMMAQFRIGVFDPTNTRVCNQYL